MITIRQLELKENYLFVDLEVGESDYYSLIGSSITVDAYTYEVGQFDNPIAIDINNTSPRPGRVTGKVYIPKATSELIKIVAHLNYNGLTGDEPCWATKSTYEFYLYDKPTIAKKGIPYLKELASTCETPQGFIDYLLNKKALDLAIESCDVNRVLLYWNNIMGSTNKTLSKSCGCGSK